MAIFRVRAIPSPKEVSESLAQELHLSQKTAATLDSGGANQIHEESASDSLRLSGSTCHQKFFLTVLSGADFDLIVDEIWANMKKDIWKTKAELRAGLLAFMQSLPGN